MCGHGLGFGLGYDYVFVRVEAAVRVQAAGPGQAIVSPVTPISFARQNRCLPRSTGQGTGPTQHPSFSSDGTCVLFDNILDHTLCFNSTSYSTQYIRYILDHTLCFNSTLNTPFFFLKAKKKFPFCGTRDRPERYGSKRCPRLLFKITTVY